MLLWQLFVLICICVFVLCFPYVTEHASDFHRRLFILESCLDNYYQRKHLSNVCNRNMARLETSQSVQKVTYRSVVLYGVPMGHLAIWPP